ncbi:hypothetical protein XENORESO_014442 [Xenotaenia resolanae]|uniref:Uncharacterized protein n=1 Tax=Xenotaenia resolanae TaxID=208358 RepID=A0ABV0VM19_9TELE
MEKAGNSWQPSRLARGEGGFFDPRIHHAIEAERQRALYEIVASMRRSPAPSFTRLSTEPRHCFPAHDLAPDQPSCCFRLLILFLIRFRGGFMDEPPPHPDPVSGPVPEGFLDEEDAPSPPAVSRQLRCRTPRPRQRSQRSPHCNSELHRGFSWSVIGFTSPAC